MQFSSYDPWFHIQIRTMGMVRSRFHSLPSVFRDSLVPHSSKKEKKGNLKGFLRNKIFKVNNVFHLVYNEKIAL